MRFALPQRAGGGILRAEMCQEAPLSPPRAGGYEFADEAEGRYRGWLLVFPMEVLWESPQPLGNALDKMLQITPLQWERLLSEEARRGLGADSYAAFFETLSRTRAKTSVRLTRPTRRLPFSARPRRYACGNLLLLRDGWYPGSPYELYAFSTEGVAVAGKGYRHRLSAAGMQLVCSGTLPADR